MHSILLRAAGALLLAILGKPAAAHDFWLQPEAFQADVGQPLGLTLLVGHGEARERSLIARERIMSFVSIGPGGTVDRLDVLRSGEPGSDATLTFDAPGTHLLALETNGTPSMLPADRFDDYVAAEGLTLLAEDRQARDVPDAPGTEIYSRVAKSVIAIGAPDLRAPSAHVTRPVGLTLEIVPQVDPGVLAPGDALAVTVLWRGEPLPDALVKLTELANDAVPVSEARTDAGGAAAFAIPRAGAWLLNVVWAVPMPEGQPADYLTVFSSLSLAMALEGG